MVILCIAYEKEDQLKIKRIIFKLVLILAGIVFLQIKNSAFIFYSKFYKSNAIISFIFENQKFLLKCLKY